MEPMKIMGKHILQPTELCTLRGIGQNSVQNGDDQFAAYGPINQVGPRVQSEIHSPDGPPREKTDSINGNPIGAMERGMEVGPQNNGPNPNSDQDDKENNSRKEGSKSQGQSAEFCVGKKQRTGIQ
ncbi:hypothetical protein L6452_43700 [Arctium lappa]|uniref:Uncharacterized protein n=1 Tax=Arctium lappa TaxID=4217 RepID=A0ACB8XEF3_ARCLA|nr:hypothetical protein L6452_43700 [Arctium lappa]